jgi:MFS family permease
MLPLFVQNTHGFTTSQTGMLFGAFWILSTALQPVLGNLSDVVGRKRVAASGMAIAAVLIAMIAAVPTPLSLTVVVILGAGTLGGIRAVLLAAMVDVAGQRESTTLGFAFAVMDGVGALGAVLAGVLGSIDLTYAFLFSAAVTFAAMGLSLVHRFE